MLIDSSNSENNKLENAFYAFVVLERGLFSRLVREALPA